MPSRPSDARVSLGQADADALRSDLATWTVDAVENAVGERATRALSREQVLPAVRAARAAGNEPTALLTRLLMLGDELTREQVDAALPTLGAEGGERIGLLRAAGAGAGDAVRAAVDLRPYTAADGDAETTWWVASDLGESVTGTRLADDHVLGIGGATITLASLTIRQQVGRTLDLGTGSGIQALHATTHSREVVATDISRQALAFAEFNRRLNVPLAAWDARHGSLLEPVEGEQFDLVVSNPPFVITPPGAPSFEYRDGGVGGDGIVRSLLTDIGAVLAPGGIAQMLGNWEIRRGEEWRARVGSWLDAGAARHGALDAWVVQRDVLDAAEYAETWLRDAGVTPERDRAGFEAAYAAYLDDFDARGVEAIGFGFITLRRPHAGRGLRRLEEHEGPLPTPMGPHLLASMDAWRWLESHSDEAVLAERWVVAGDVTQESYARPGTEHPEHILLRQGAAFGRSVRADTALAGFVGACDGELTGSQIAAALSVLMELPAGDVSGALALAVRDLARDGFLTRAG